ncbi:MAG: hypothetical protein LBU84_10010, partial [Prevotella sp.]|nr:hypothetical protein [Prevotella sp.]
MFIDKWWGNYIGGSDDSFLLFDYFGTRNSTVFNLNDILQETGLSDLLINGGLENGDLSFHVKEGYVPHFDMAIDVLIDLSAIVLECLHNQRVAIKYLDNSSNYSNTISISAKPEDLMLLTNGLDNFIKNPKSYELSDMMDEESLSELLADCNE